MLTCIKDVFDNIICACEWRKVNESCEFDTKGNYIWVHTVEISKQYWNKNILYELIRKILDEMPNAKYCWFRREKYKLRRRGYPRSYWERLVGVKLKEKKYEYA